jgi:cytochrome c-type biogenesis protein CcmH
MIWLLCGLVTLVVVAALLWPLLRGAAPTADRAAYDATVFRDQLKELERDQERGVITAVEAEAARIEIQRRLLATGKAAPTPVHVDGPGQRAAMTAAIAVIVPFVALGVYLTVGAPQLTGQQKAAPADQAAEGHPEGDMSKLVEKLAARVHETPENPQGWSLLARTYRQMQRFPEAADAYKHLMELTPDDADAFAGFAEAAAGAAGGTVTPEAHEAFVHALEIDSTEPRSRFYLGVELAQQGNPQEAIAVWRELTASAPEGAPWVGTVREQMASVAQEAGIMPMSVAPMHALEAFGKKTAQATPASPQKKPEIMQAPADPSSPDVSALKGKFSAQNLDMIKGMVGGLAARLKDNPDDYDGWMRLGRAYTVLENMNGAKDAYARAAKLKPQELAPKLQLADLLARETDLDKKLSPELVKVAADIHAIDAREPDALFILGLDKANTGDAKGARALWQSALDVLPAATPLHSEITRRMAALR